MTIFAYTLDNKIVNESDVIIDLISLMTQSPTEIQISTKYEGPCLRTLNFYNLLDKLCERFHYEKHKIKIITSNMLEHHSEYSIINDHNFWELEAVQTTFRDNGSPEKNFTNSFKHFGHFIGHGNKYRLKLASYLWNNHKDCVLQTYHYAPNIDYHREFIGLEDLLHNEPDISSNIQQLEFLYSTPIKLDDVKKYPILTYDNLNICNQYTNFFVEIVNNTVFSGNVFYIDEKVYRPMALETPFMIQGPQDFLHNLQKLGFQTFSKYWDEGYSEDPADSQPDGIIENIKIISKLSTRELELMYKDMKPILSHNRERLFNITKQEIEEVFN